jgi:cellulose 1,4-beta-cellobiosidase
MDIWEANSLAAAYTPHPCDAEETKACSGDECSQVCDSPGCDFNAYRMGQHNFYGPNGTVDSTKLMTVVTQFYTDTGEDDGVLLEIERLYVQDGKVIENANVDIEGFPAEYNYLDDKYCDVEADVFNSGDSYVFAELGGMTQMGKALGRGMVLAMSIWSSDNGGMLWLDGNTGDTSLPGNLRGPCTADVEDAEYIQENFPDAAVTFSNIRWGEIGTTYES